MRKYKALTQQTHHNGEFEIVPIRHEDRFKIMEWRNEQIYHLRQNEPLTEEEQDKYFNTTIAALFKEERPNQILFSFLKGGKCCGYGGLVHIDWLNKNAEISFIMKTAIDKQEFDSTWKGFLPLIERVAFKELNLHKIYTYAFDVRPHLYSVFESVGYFLDARLVDHCFFDKGFRDVVIHSKIKSI